MIAALPWLCAIAGGLMLAGMVLAVVRYDPRPDQERAK